MLESQARTCWTKINISVQNEHLKKNQVDFAQSNKGCFPLLHWHLQRLVFPVYPSNSNPFQEKKCTGEEHILTPQKRAMSAIASFLDNLPITQNRSLVDDMVDITTCTSAVIEADVLQPDLTAPHPPHNSMGLWMTSGQPKGGQPKRNCKCLPIPTLQDWTHNRWNSSYLR